MVYSGNVAGGARPNRVSWLLWSVMPLIAAAAGYADGARWVALPVFMAGVTPLMVFTASFFTPQAYWKLGRLDYFCGFLSLAALALWGITHEPLVAIVLAIMSDGFASLPTIVKTWQHPATESSFTYLGGIVSALTGFFALQTWVFAEYGFLVYVIIQNGIVVFAIYRDKLGRRL